MWVADGSLHPNYYFHRSVIITIMLSSCDLETSDGVGDTEG